MAKYRKILDRKKLAEYVELARPAITEAGGKFIVRGMPAATFEDGLRCQEVMDAVRRSSTERRWIDL